MRVLVTGVKGQLGSDVIRELQSRDIEYLGTDLSMWKDEHFFPLDITDVEKVEESLKKYRPDAVIHCAAWTAVDDAEDKREAVFLVNGNGTKNLAKACEKYDCKMMYISTDYVFDGQGTEPWKPDCREFGPLNVYGESKLEGEKRVAGRLKKYFIVRTAWVFGDSITGNNFVKTMLDVGKKHETVRVVCDQIGTPTYTYDLARLLVDMIESEKYGYYHATNEGGYISWYDFAKEIFKQAGYSTQVIPVTTEEYGISKAKRPFNSRLDKSKLIENGFLPLPTWQDALKRYLKELEDMRV